MPRYTVPLKSKESRSVYGSGGSNFALSGSTSGNLTANWRIHIQNVEIMYTRVTQYKTLDGTSDFNYLDCNVVMEASREHIYLNASAGDMTQQQTLELISDASTGGYNGAVLGSSGVVRTVITGLTRREVRAGDVENVTRAQGNFVVGKFPGAFSSSFDTSTATNSTVLDMLMSSKSSCPDFELSLLDL